VTQSSEFEGEGMKDAAAAQVQTHRSPALSRQSEHSRPRLTTSAAGAALAALALLAVTCGGGSASAALVQDGSDRPTATTTGATGGDSTGSVQASFSGRQPRGKDWRAFAAWLRKRAAAGRFSGAVLIAQHGKPVVSQANGFANRQQKLPNALDTKFNIGSVGKTFTAVAIAQLAEEGKLSFDDPIGKHLSGFPAEVADRITIDQLLTHTSGLGDVFVRWHPTAPSPLDVSDLLGRIVTEPLEFEPGSRFGYSNSGFVVLGAIVEAVSGQDYYDYVRTRVFRPAAMTQTGWYRPDQVRNMAHGYARVDASGMLVAGNPSGGAYSTVGDLFRFAQALLKHRLLSPQMTKIVLAGKVDTPRPGPAQTRYGYGFEEELRNGVRIVGHGGGEPGIEAQLRILPALGYTIIVLTNQDGANRPVYERATRMLTGAGGPP
jgi:CubicO group peptidase (beta-lactamase class C family)